MTDRPEGFEGFELELIEEMAVLRTTPDGEVHVGQVALASGRGKSRMLDWLDAQTIERLRFQGREVHVLDPKGASLRGQVSTARELGGQA